MPPTSRKRRAPVDEEDGPISTQASQRNRNRESPLDGDEDVEEEQGSGSGSIAQLSKSLVRYALACEYARVPIKRQDVSQKVLGSHSRAFKDVFTKANGLLIEVFGMEMVELPNREKVTMRQKRAAAASESQSKTSGQWVLRTMLPDRYRIPEVIPPASIPTSETESSYVGFYSMVIALISLSRGTLPESRLDRFLKRMNAEQSTPVDRTDKVLARMIKEGYIVRIKDSSGGEDVVDYMVGPRGKVEVGEEGVANLVRTVSGSAIPDLEQRLHRSLGISGSGAPVPSQRAVNDAGGASTQGAVRRGAGRPRRGGAADADE
ncbi:MAGE-domain-containing protein [Lindgomyces ingoldianus]|uniref:MAGE-domain-containing protein n=1 Tax=Lindgomyces ingoldianus TaxID=673940 RepID=A0ACB6RC49_9PLEO|nr:MAGE-domain-containing protein [Lindgomyces ingoldianus]KAF2476829.1 MAGE-domain-containing protein [Lindgomyces ingoldianus]